MKKTILLPTYDFDGNILSPKTSILLYDQETWEDIEVSYHEYDQNPHIYKYSWRYKLHDDLSITYSRSSDFHWYNNHPWPDGLIKDTQDALQNNLLSPSFENFKQLALIEANIFAILTARWHGADNIQRAVQLISNEVLDTDEKKNQKDHIKEKYYKLLDEYKIWSDRSVDWFFNHIPSYMWVDNYNFCKSINIDHHNSTSYKKTLAIDNHYNRVNTLYSQIWDIKEVRFAKWFSDDNISNIVDMTKYFMDQSKITDDIYRVYFSWKKEGRGIVKDLIKAFDWSDQIKFDNSSEIIMKIII